MKHGGDPAKAIEASAVVMAESSGDTQVFNGSCCYGGYQFHTNTLSRSCAVNPDCATKAAIRISSNGKDWGKWEAHTTGAHQQFTSIGDTLKDFIRPFSPGDLYPGAGNAPNPLEDITGLGGLAEALSGIAGFFVGLGELILTPEGWKRLGKMIGGAILVLWGLNTLMKVTVGSPVGTATKVATLAATKGKVG